MALVMTPIYTQTVGAGGASAIVFNNIPQVFTDLQMVVSGRTNQSGSTFSTVVFFLNGDGTAGSFTNLAGDGGSAFSTRATGYMDGTYLPAANATASTFGNASFYIPNYTSSNFKSVIVDGVMEHNATTAYSNLRALLWRNTAAITAIGINGGAGNFVQHSTFSLYGIIRSGA